MKILLAPMEGVVDSVLRDLITRMGGVDYCVTEFVRVTQHILPTKVFFQYCPELHNGSRTAAGTPVFVQLLGGQPDPMAENAAMADSLGAFGIDLNFGCPAKTVNRHDGGAALLKSPDRVFEITRAVRAAVHPDKPVTVKVRLGYDNKNYVTEIAQAASEGGAHWLTVHGRTKTEGYRPPAHWEEIATMGEAASIEVIANGDIWSPEDHARCQKVSGCQSTMLGRGLVARPSLALEIRGQTQRPNVSYWKPFLETFLVNSQNLRHEKYAVCRLKQLSKLMSRTYPEMGQLFQEIKRLQKVADMQNALKQFFPTSKNQASEKRKYDRGPRAISSPELSPSTPMF